MEEWVTDFVQSDTTYMVLRNKRKLGGDDLNRVQVKMLASSNVPHVLDLHVREVDAEAELHYNIGGKRMLSTCMKTEKINLVEYYALLLQIVTALEYGMTYMLNPNGFLLKEDYMFVEGPLSEGTVYLTYLPLNKSAELAPNRERIGGLAARWMTVVDDLRGTGVQRILQMCEQPSFSLQSLKNLLIGLLAGSGKQPTGGLEAAGAAAPKPFPPMDAYPDARYGAGIYGEDAARAERRQEPGFSSAGAALPDTSGAYREPVSAFPGDHEGKSAAGLRRLFGGQGSRGKGVSGKSEEKAGFGGEPAEEQANGRLVMPLISVLLLALAWKFLYLDNPGTASLLICAAATPLLLVAAYLGWARKLTLGNQGAKRRQEQEEADALAASWQEPRGASVRRISYGQREGGEVPATDSSGGARVWGTPEHSGGEGRSVPDFLKPAPAHAGGFEEGGYRGGSRLQAEEFRQPTVVPGTGMLVPPASQPTVMLDSGHGTVSADGSGRAGTGPRYRLERLENGSLPQSIVLPSGNFTIGRAQEVSQHVETAAGISRAHVELELTDNQCLIKDIGSRNGTLLNDEAITPYKAYELHEGDTFKIAGISYTLRCG